MRRPASMLFLTFALIYLAPVAVSATLYFFGSGQADWRSADRSTTSRTARPGARDARRGGPERFGVNSELAQHHCHTQLGGHQRCRRPDV